MIEEEKKQTSMEEGPSENEMPVPGFEEINTPEERAGSVTAEDSESVSTEYAETARAETIMPSAEDAEDAEAEVLSSRENEPVTKKKKRGRLFIFLLILTAVIASSVAFAYPMIRRATLRQNPFEYLLSSSVHMQSAEGVSKSKMTLNNSMIFGGMLEKNLSDFMTSSLSNLDVVTNFKVALKPKVEESFLNLGFQLLYKQEELLRLNMDMDTQSLILYADKQGYRLNYDISEYLRIWLKESNKKELLRIARKYLPNIKENFSSLRYDSTVEITLSNGEKAVVDKLTYELSSAEMTNLIKVYYDFLSDPELIQLLDQNLSDTLDVAERQFSDLLPEDYSRAEVRDGFLESFAQIGELKNQIPDVPQTSSGNIYIGMDGSLVKYDTVSDTMQMIELENTVEYFGKNPMKNPPFTGSVDSAEPVTTLIELAERALESSGMNLLNEDFQNAGISGIPFDLKTMGALLLENFKQSITN